MRARPSSVQAIQGYVSVHSTGNGSDSIYSDYDGSSGVFQGFGKFSDHWGDLSYSVYDLCQEPKAGPVYVDCRSDSGSSGRSAGYWTERCRHF